MHITRLIYKFFEAIHNCIVGIWDWAIEKLNPYSREIMLIDLIIAVLLLIIFSLEWGR